MESESENKPPKYLVSLFLHVLDNDPKPRVYEWVEFCASMLPHQTQFLNKKDCYLFSPALFAPGRRRALENVVSLSMLVLDVDGENHEGVDESTMAEAISFLEETGTAGLLYTSWSHAKALPKWKFRLVIPLSRPVSVEDWPGFWHRANAIFGGIADTQCAEAAHMYFGVFVHPDDIGSSFSHVVTGEPLNVDLVLQEVPPPSLKGKATSIARPLGTRKVTREELGALANKLKKRNSAHLAETGSKLALVSKGEIYAEPGERDITTFKITSVLAEHFPDGSAESIAAHFGPSLQLMSLQAPEAPTIADVVTKLQRHQLTVQQRAEEDQEDKEAELRSRILEAFNDGRSTPYTPEEVLQIKGRWILQRMGTYYIWVGGEYRQAYVEKEVLSAAYRDLAPAHSVGVELFKMTAKGPERKSIGELMKDHGTVITNVELSLTARKSTYEPTRRVLIEAPCPLRNIQPCFHPEIAEWLKLMCPTDALHDKLLTWITTVTLLEEICVALVLTGPKGSGKSLLALGLSRLWSLLGPTGMNEALAQFNDGLLKCPLVFADEALPKDFRGHSKNQELRWHIQALSRPLLRKYLPAATLVGATRTIIASNDPEVLATAEVTGAHEIRATADRYLHIPVREGATVNYPSPAALFFQKTNTSGWVDRDMIAQHALWLRDNHKWEREGRFLIDVTDAELKRSMVNRNQAAAMLLQWLCGFLHEPELYKQSAKDPYCILVSDGKLLVNSRGVISNWSLYVEHERCPPPGALTRVLASLSHWRLQRNIPNVGKLNFREIDLEQVIAWAEYSGWTTKEKIMETLAED